MKKSNEHSLLSSNEKYYFGPSRFRKKGIDLKSIDGTLDFTIKDGNHSQEIFIDSVVWNSQAYLQGMRPGDEILSVNGISIQSKINSTQALQILYSMRELHLIIRSLRVNDLDGTLYNWYDPIEQRVTSPPPSTYLSLDYQLPYFQRTVTIRVEKGKRLGLVIRGGSEYGLGIFISGVDKDSLSDQSGLSIGDQILSVNGIDFCHITHENAVQLLRNLNQMSFHLRQMNKLPQPKESFEEKRFIENDLINETINFIFNSNDQRKIKKIFKEYFQEKILIDQLVNHLLQISNKENEQNRNQFLQSIRKFIRQKDLDRFDIWILKDQLKKLKFSHDRLIEDSFSSSRMSIHSSNEKSKSLENLRKENINRPQSLIFEDQERKELENFSPKIERKVKMNSLRKSESIHNVADEHFLSSISKSRNDLNNEMIEQFLQDYSTPYPITIHKVRSTLGVAIEGGFEDRIPLPRIVYMQPDGCAYVSSGLRVGHVIIGVNGYSMKGLRHREAALILASGFKDKQSSQMDLFVVEPKDFH